ncbi:MAG: hypothetical protein EZS28_042277 [Streblomastix strix]|uniref:Uncharacterized protein n=1 Tax=Streblomastix strix TaxID=222440 RepID=A0A5J4TUM2_9EUKA|nr:MAG: hypothetical protein EZS28_042277 [Streblomastix strix]
MASSGLRTIALAYKNFTEEERSKLNDEYYKKKKVEQQEKDKEKQQKEGFDTDTEQEKDQNAPINEPVKSKKAKFLNVEGVQPLQKTVSMPPQTESPSKLSHKYKESPQKNMTKSEKPSKSTALLDPISDKPQNNDEQNEQEEEGDNKIKRERSKTITYIESKINNGFC